MERSYRGPLFAVGMWRSGTSLFYALVNQHPQIALLYEGDLPLLWPLFLGGKAKSDWPWRWEFWNSAPSRHQIDLPNLPRNVSTLREACELIWSQYAGSAVGGCKSPNYFDMLPRLAREFPGARFIVIWRNPTDVCRSIIRASKSDFFFAKWGMMLRALRGCHELKRGVDQLLQQAVPVHEVQYETLVKDPVEVMEGVCRFLDLKFDARMASLRDADRSAIYDDPQHEMVKGERIAVDRDNREVLPPRVARKITRYIAAWHELYKGRWPAVPVYDHSQPPRWFALERAFDALRYRTLRGVDHSVAFLYCFAPLWLLRKYRALRGRGDATVTKEQGFVTASLKD